MPLRSRNWVLLSAGACLLPLLLQLPLRIGLTVALSALAVVAMSRRQPLRGWVRLLLAMALFATVLTMSGLSTSELSIGGDTGCALLAAMLAIKPAETFGLRDARSLLGFALFAPFATFLLDQGPLSLTLGLAATVMTLAALQLLADIESGDVRRDASPLQRMAGTARLLALGLPLALAAFWLFPRLGSPLWGIPERAMASTGLSDRMSPGDWIDLMADDSPALRARFFGPAPSPTRMYWRGPVMWDFDGRTWTQPRWMPGWTKTTIEPGPQRWDYEIEMEPTDHRQLVALDLLISAPSGSELAPDHNLQALAPLTGISRWRMQSAPPLNYEARLSPQTRQRALRLSPNLNPRTLALARQWRLEAGPHADSAIVTRALDWIRRDFAYTLETPLPGHDSVDEFLFDQRAGFCQHFSSAFVVLMRGAGIPARVVTGYVGGHRNSVGGYWLVRRSDAHAWAEVWLHGRGWVRMDPTAAVAPERIYDTLANRRSVAGRLLDGLMGTRALIDIGDWLRHGWNDFVLGFDATRQQHLLRPFGIDRINDRVLVLLLMLAAALGLLWMVWFSHRNEREPDPVLRAWRAMALRYRRFGLERFPDEPASRWVERVAAARPELAGPLRILSEHFSDWRYADGKPGERSSRALTQALHAHRPPPRNG